MWCQELADVRDCCFVAAGKNGCCLGRARRMFKSHSHCWPGTPRRTTAHRIYNHQDGVVSSEKPIDLFRSARVFDAVLVEVGAHRGNELFGIRHEPILAKVTSIQGSFRWGRQNPVQQLG
jgi:hypothetical protein